MNDNLIFLSESDLNKPIYRIFSFNRLKEIFNNNKLTLVKPKLWDDPFENFIFNSIGKLVDGHTFTFGFRENYYGQCWSLNKENDAMWRIYSPTIDKINNGIKVKTTIGKLFSCFYNVGYNNYEIDGRQYNISSFIGKVQYQNSDELLKNLDEINIVVNDQTGKRQASTFLYKREAFEHEREIRVIYYDDYKNKTDIFSVEINAMDIFDEIVLDPRIRQDEYIKYEKEIRSWGYTKEIYQSNLYKIPILNNQFKIL